MTRAEFMGKLKELLSDLSESEREEVLTYYEEYFEDAGRENEQAVIESLGSPKKTARIIKEGLKDSQGEQGEFTEHGFCGYENEEKEELGQPGRKKHFLGKRNRLGGGELLLLIILAVFAFPILIPVVSAVLAVIFAIIVAIAAVLFAVLIAGVALVIAAGCLLIGGIVMLFHTAGTGVLMLGAGLVSGGIGILLTILGVRILRKIVPAVVRWIVKILQKLFRKPEIVSGGTDPFR